jgi:hypothetical protein
MLINKLLSVFLVSVVAGQSPLPMNQCIRMSKRPGGTCPDGYAKWLPPKEGYYVAGHNIDDIKDLTADQCRQKCWSNPGCACADFTTYAADVSGLGICYLNNADTDNTQGTNEHLLKYQCCQDRCNELSSASMAVCQFNILVNSATEVSNQDGRCEECMDDQMCVGIYQDPNSGRWKKLMPIKGGRRFYEENCFTNSQKTSFPMFLVKSRVQSMFDCKPSFNLLGTSNSRSKYFMDRVTRSYQDAKARCAQDGGRLAELTTPEEFQMIDQIPNKIDTFVGAVIRAGASNTMSNWYWPYSNMPASDGYMWSGGTPNERQSTLISHLWATHGFRLDDIWQDSTQPSTLCECQDTIVTYN